MTDSPIIHPDQASEYDEETRSKRQELEQRLERLKRRVGILEVSTEAVDVSRSVLEKTVDGLNRKQRRKFASQRKRLKKK